MDVILESEPINIPNPKKCRANHGLDGRQKPEELKMWLANKKVEYEDAVMSKFLASDKDDRHKHWIINSFETGYSFKTNYDESKILRPLAIKLRDIDFRKFRCQALRALVNDLGVPAMEYKWMTVSELIEKIDHIRAKFQDEPKIDVIQKLDGVDFRSLKGQELIDFAIDLGLTMFCSLTRATIIQQIGLVKKYYQDKPCSQMEGN